MYPINVRVCLGYFESKSHNAGKCKYLHECTPFVSCCAGHKISNETEKHELTSILTHCKDRINHKASQIVC